MVEHRILSATGIESSSTEGAGRAGSTPAFPTLGVNYSGSSFRVPAVWLSLLKPTAASIAPL